MFKFITSRRRWRWLGERFELFQKAGQLILPLLYPKAGAPHWNTVDDHLKLNYLLFQRFLLEWIGGQVVSNNLLQLGELFCDSLHNTHVILDSHHSVDLELDLESVSIERFEVIFEINTTISR